MTVDVRAVNAQTEAMFWPMLMLEVVMDHLQGAKVFFVIDFFKGYWQLPFAEASQELFSILTDEDIYTPTRVLMGGSDSVANCQAAVQEIFARYLYKGVMTWLDDVLGYAVSEEKLLCFLEAALGICKDRVLKLNPAKCGFYKQEVKWCGRIISASGVRHDANRIDALCGLASQRMVRSSNNLFVRQIGCEPPSLATIVWWRRCSDVWKRCTSVPVGERRPWWREYNSMKRCGNQSSWRVSRKARPR
jgi:hypothetical protein